MFSDASQLPETVKALQGIYESACMPLQEWASDLPDIRKLVPADLCNPDHCISVLGLGCDMIRRLRVWQILTCLHATTGMGIGFAGHTEAGPSRSLQS